MKKDAYYGLSRETLLKILDNILYEVYVTDAALNIIYVSKNCRKHYGLMPEEMIGRNHAEFSGIYWYPSVLPQACTEKRRMCIQQVTVTGETIISTAVPVFDADGNVKMTVSIVQEAVVDLDMNVELEAGSQYNLWARRNTDIAVPASDIITRSPKMRTLLTLGKRAADKDIPVLIQGDSGTGKGMLARFIHENSARSKFPFLAINCAAIPENLLESELFGYAPYAFTGASNRGKAGLIEQADGGTLFLDELGELALPLQAKLLNVVENNQYMQVGGKEIKYSNVRIISATNQDLERQVRENAFREDLFWRLNIIDLKIPSLMERREDILPLASYYLNFCNKKYKTNKVMAEEVFDVFLRYSWPGNVRQLRNIIERAFVLSVKPEIAIEDLPYPLLQAPEDEVLLGVDLCSQLEALERKFIRDTWAAHGSSRKMAAALGVSQSKANRLMRKHLGGSSEGHWGWEHAEQGNHNVTASPSDHNGGTASPIGPALGEAIFAVAPGYGLSRDQLFDILEHTYNEVYVLDRDMKIIYVNPACYMHYGLRPEEMIGRNHNDFTGDVWYPSVVPNVYREKRKMCVEQIVYTGKRLVSCASPVLDANNEIEMLICLTEETFEHLDIQYNPAENTIYDRKASELEAENFGEIITVSDEMKTLYKTALRASRQDLPVLLQGESGTGKSMLAKFIHDSGSRKKGRYLAINCAAIPCTLLESELFGYKPHAFTGANPKGKEGLVRLADKGTLFLDEIAELALPLQAKLLDVLENKTFIPIGGSEVERADVRIIAATNKDLQDMVNRRVFREDLYWRINVVDIKVPPLRNRIKDIKALAYAFLDNLNAKYGTCKTFSQGVMDLFLRYEWPGNIRQFRNAIERAAVISEHDVISVEDLPQNILREMEAETGGGCTYEEYREAGLRKIIQAARQKYTTCRKVAEALRISHTTANRLMQKYLP